jgi:glycerol uptake facilitator-like aquaporin
VTPERRFVAELIGTGLLVGTVVGSGIMGERLAGGNLALALLANSIATGAVLIALIASFAGISGAHFNPVVSLVEALLGRMSRVVFGLHVAAQVLGGIAGTIAAHWMFELPAFTLSEHIRTGPAQWWSELVATFGLITIILQVAKHRPAQIPYAVGGYVTAAYWFTASTSFANPAVTIARSLTDSFSGIRPVDVPAFIVSQIVGALLALVLVRWMNRPIAQST